MSEARASAAGGSLWVRARQLLATYRGDRTLPAAEWLELATEAYEFALSTFPEERRERALRGFLEKNCVGQAPRTIAVFAVALRLFGEKRLREGFGQFGACLEAAAIACGTTIDELPPPRDPGTVESAVSVVAAVQARAKQEQMLNRHGTVSGVDYWN